MHVPFPLVFSFNGGKRMWDDMSINTAISKIRDCSQEEENFIFNKYINMIVSLASKRVDSRFKTRIDPESIALSVMESFFQGVRETRFDFDNWQMVYGLLVKITIRKSHNRNVLHSAKKRLGPEQVVDGPGEVGFEEWQAQYTGPSPEEEVIARDLLETIRSKLEEREAQLLDLKLAGHSRDEIGQCAAVGTITVTKIG
jgi:hypothetical protein